MTTVAALHRYPVKSLTGESVDRLALDARGVVGDRTLAVRTADGGLGSGKTTGRFTAVPGLLLVRAATAGGSVVLTLPDGSTYDAADADGPLSELLGQRVHVVHEDVTSHVDDGPVSLLGTASVAALAAERGADVDPVRFRPNLLLATERAFCEDDWVGRTVQIGTATLGVTMTSPRCVMVDLETADLPAQQGNLRAVGLLHDACLGVIADVLVPGTVAVGDEVVLL